MQPKNKGMSAALPALPQRIVVGTDGTRESMGALRLAAAFERATEASVNVVTAVETIPTPMIPTASALPVLEVEASRRRVAMTQMRRQVLAVRPTGRWNLSTVIGWPTEAILDLAKDSQADLMIVGIGRHRPIDRLLAHETAVAVARRAKVPLLAAAPRARRRPRHALVAVDFTPESVEAARIAGVLVGEQGRLTLVHVSPFHGREAKAVAWRHTYDTGARDQLRLLKSELAGLGCTVSGVILHGYSPDELLRYARRRHVDLIAVGGHKQGFMDRLVIGSVATRMLRGAECSVLVVPKRGKR